MNTTSRLILIQLLVLVFVSTGWSAPRKKTRVTRTVTVSKKTPAKKSWAKKKVIAKKVIAKNTKRTKKMSEKDRKALARRQVEHARLVASLRKEQKQTPLFKANPEVTIRDYGFENTPITAEEQAVRTASVKTEDLTLEESNDEDLGFED